MTVLKKSYYFFISIFVLICCFAGTVCCFATESVVTESGTCGEGVYYDLYDNGTLVVGGAGEIEAASFFDRADITEVIIEQGITAISENAFAWCVEIKELSIADTVTLIGDNAFSVCTALESIEIPGSVEIIGEGVFSNCEVLKSVEICEGTVSVGDSAFAYCSALSEVYYYGTKAQWNEIKIEDGNDCLLNANIRFDIRTVAASGKCGENVGYVLYDDGELVISGQGKMEEYRYDFEMSNSTSPFARNNNIKSLVISDGVTRISQYAFYFCENLENITIADSVVSIGRTAFNNTAYYKDKSNWENLNGFEDWVLYIGKHLITVKFEEDDGPETLEIKDGTTVLADNIMQEDGVILNVIIPDTVTHIGKSAFYCSDIKEITIGSGVVSIGSGAFDECNYLTDIYYKGTQEQWKRIGFYSEDITVHFLPSDGDVCSHKNTTEQEEVAPTCTTDGHTAGLKCDDCLAFLDGTVIKATGHKLNFRNECENCDEVMSEILPGQTKTIDVSCGEITYLKFTPAVSGTYSFEPNSRITYVYICDADRNILDYNGFDYDISYKLEAGRTYYWGAKLSQECGDTEIEVSLMYDDIRSVSFAPVQEYILTACSSEGQHKVDRLNEEYYHYAIPEFETGDKFTVCDYNWDEYDYFYNEELSESVGGDVFTSADDVSILVEKSDDQKEKHWTYDVYNNYFTLKYMGVTCDVYVEIYEHLYEYHDGKDPDCNNNGWEYYETCKCCDYTTYKEISAKGHSHVNHSAKSATCTEKGWNAYKTCKNCSYTTYKEISAKGHSYVNHEAKSATCTEKGWNAYKTCKNCSYTTYKQISAKGHSYVNHSEKSATCTSKGWNAYKTCKNCSYTTYKEIPAKGHSYVNHEAKSATCTSKGWNAYKTCKNCSYTTYKEISAKGHSYVNHSAKSATCTSKGWNAYKTCKNCSHTTYKEISAKGHKLTIIKAIASTCTKTGLTEGKKCSVCNTVITKQKTVTKKKHISDKGTVTKKATYKATGTKTYKCKTCKTVLKTETIKRLTLKKVSGLKVTPAATTLKLSWTKVKGAEKYEVYYSTNGRKWTKATTAKNSVTVKKLKSGTTYRVKVRALAGKNTGASSAVITTSTKPATVTLSKVTAGKKTATPVWKTVTGASGYEIQYSTSSKFKSAKTAAVKKGSTKKTTIKKLTKGKKYYFKVRAYKTVDGKKVYGAWSAVKNVKVK